MEDIKFCPICNNRLRTLFVTRYVHILKKSADFIERACTLGENHSLQFLTNKATKQIDLLKMSLNADYTKFIEINYLQNNCRIVILNGMALNCIDISKILHPDFPDLTILKKKVSILTTFN